ncbi:MAG: ankyrin repeat domain-containing protein [Bacteroidota bacterium]
MAAGDWKEMLLAAQNGDLELVKYHIHMGENPNYQHPEFLTTPLIESATFGHLEIVQFLLDNDADPNIRAGFSSDTALSMARRNKHRAVVKLLKKYRNE